MLQDGGDAGDGTEIQITCEEDLPPAILRDDVLKRVELRMGKTYTCFSGLNPMVNLSSKISSGHKINGAP